MWHNGVKIAFGDVMKNRGYDAKYIPDWGAAGAGYGKVYHDDGATKALLKWQRDGSGNILRDSTDGYYMYETDTNGDPIYSGYRFIMNSGGNILINQHMNPNDSAQMLEAIPSCGETGDPNNADDLCIVSFDPFLSPSPRWSDYVLPAATQWEMDNRITLTYGNAIITPVASNPPGEALSTYDFTVAFLKAYEKIDSNKAGIANQFVGRDSASASYIQGDKLIDKYKRAYGKAVSASTYTGVYSGKTFEEALRVQTKPRNPNPMNTSATPVTASVRTNIEAYLVAPDRDIRPHYVGANATGSTFGEQYPNGVMEPNTSGRAEVYMPRLQWQYEHRFMAYHKYLPLAERGQMHRDREGDAIVYPITMYYDYEDYFMEAFGGPDKLPPKGNRFVVTTTHDRYRAHSTYSEAPYCRELTTRTRNGKLYSGNDWGTYAISEIGSDGTISRLNKSITDRDFTKASWADVWMNDEDAAEHEINDGDIIQLDCPIGSVRVAARVTKRAVRGFIGLHQGCWYDPDPVDGVDDGGCANTIMATKPSRIDHGNGQQSAMVSVKKVTF
jgi:anaerobic selenocysteine-containing dehydrogenase